MAANSKVLFSTLSFFFFIQIILSSLVEAKNNGFSIDLIHRDSLVSPYYNASMSPMERLNKAFHRSFKRAALFKPSLESSDTIQTPIHRISGEYLMKVAIGSPPVEMLSIADTGSDLAWIQCKPCTECYSQNTPLFDPESSSSYKNVPCQSPSCGAADRSSCASDNYCQYMISYGDRSFTEGNLAVETFTFGSTSGQSISIPNIVFGCGHENSGTFKESGSGIIGLGGGSLSIINQLSKYIDGKFSYCLVPFGSSSSATSQLNFGSNAIVSGAQVVSTPLVKKAPNTYYYLTLEGISVGDKRLEYQSSTYSKASYVEDGNIIIDSGTTLTLLPNDFYNSLESTLEASISGNRVLDPQGSFSLCYQKDETIEFPKIIVHFTNADLELKPSSTFFEVEAGMVCLAMVPTNELAIFGNLSQMDFLVGYDLVSNKVSFLPTDCTKQF